MRLSILAASLVLMFSSFVYAESASERKFLSNDMSEGEVLMRIGKPDNESVDSEGGAAVKVKRWIYFPSFGDAQTLTTITFKNGKVVNITRDISR